MAEHKQLKTSAEAKPDLQAFADRVREGIADYVADNMQDKKHSLEEIDRYIRGIEINAAMISTPAQSIADTAVAVRALRMARDCMEANGLGSDKVPRVFAIIDDALASPAIADTASLTYQDGYKDAWLEACPNCGHVKGQELDNGEPHERG